MKLSAHSKRVTSSSTIQDQGKKTTLPMPKQERFSATASPEINNHKDEESVAAPEYFSWFNCGGANRHRETVVLRSSLGCFMVGLMVELTQ